MGRRCAAGALEGEERDLGDSRDARRAPANGHGVETDARAVRDDCEGGRGRRRGSG